MLAVGFALLGVVLSRWIGTSLLKFDKSPILVAILLGLLIRNAIGLPSIYESGLRVCLRRVLRSGIVLLGLGLSISAMGRTALVALPIVVGCIASGLLVVTWFSRILGLPRRLGALIAVGTSICGVSAIVATAPAIDANDDEVSYAVGCITIFGLTALFSYPFLSHWVFEGQVQQAGLFLGTAIHDTALVAGAGAMYDQQYNASDTLFTATVTKLLRNLWMAGVIPLLALLYHRGNQSGERRVGQKWYSMVPLFVLGFMAMAVISTLGDWNSERAFGILAPETWNQLRASGIAIAKLFLAVAMAAVGLGTGIAKLKGLGFKPFCAGFVAALFVGLMSILFIKLIQPLI